MTDWTIQTDEEAAAERRTGAINGRYQVCHPVEGIIGSVDRLADAFWLGDHYALRLLPDGRPYCTTPYEVEVYDRMARKGQPRTWRRQPKSGTHCFEHGDRFSTDGRWKVISRNGVKPRQTDDLTQRVWT